MMHVIWKIVHKIPYIFLLHLCGCLLWKETVTMKQPSTCDTAVPSVSGPSIHFSFSLTSELTGIINSLPEKCASWSCPTDSWALRWLWSQPTLDWNYLRSQARTSQLRPFQIHHRQKYEQRKMVILSLFCILSNSILVAGTCIYTLLSWLRGERNSGQGDNFVFSFILTVWLWRGEATATTLNLGLRFNICKGNWL